VFVYVCVRACVSEREKVCGYSSRIPCFIHGRACLLQAQPTAQRMHTQTLLLLAAPHPQVERLRPEATRAEVSLEAGE